MSANFSEIKVRVELGARSYDIHIGAGLFDRLGSIVRSVANAPQATVITDRNVAAHYSARAVASLEAAGYKAGTITIPPGESSKSLATAQRLYDGLAERQRGRSDPIIALGGGVVGDLAGFVAATWMRGVPFVQCPTTTEAMIDASVGGKTAVNHESGKNLIGAFHQPVAVVIDPRTLETLDDRDYRAGFAESVKHALIADVDFLAWHEANIENIHRRDPVTLTELVRRNCRIKADTVQADEREVRHDQVGRAALNFGHTIGHALEYLSDYELRHGEAVALGMLAALHVSVQIASLDSSIPARVDRLLGLLQLPVRKEVIDVDTVIRATFRDKKTENGVLRYVLLPEIGRTVWAVPPRNEIEEALKRLIGPAN